MTVFSEIADFTPDEIAAPHCPPGGKWVVFTIYTAEGASCGIAQLCLPRQGFDATFLNYFTIYWQRRGSFRQLIDAAQQIINAISTDELWFIGRKAWIACARRLGYSARCEGQAICIKLTK